MMLEYIFVLTGFCKNANRPNLKWVKQSMKQRQMLKNVVLSILEIFHRYLQRTVFDTASAYGFAKFCRFSTEPILLLTLLQYVFSKIDKFHNKFEQTLKSISSIKIICMSTLELSIIIIFRHDFRKASNLVAVRISLKFH